MSVELEIHVEGLDDLRRKMETLSSAMKNHVHDALMQQGEVLKNTARSFAPRRTGYLESTVFARVEEWILKVGATAPYAAFLEFGTRFIFPRRFLDRALEYCMPSLVNRLNQAIAQAIQEAER
jgi:HK97 gp10 family phage protein